MIPPPSHQVDDCPSELEGQLSFWAEHPDAFAWVLSRIDAGDHVVIEADGSLVLSDPLDSRVRLDT